MQHQMVKTLHLKLTGTLSGNRTLTMPASTTGGTCKELFYVSDETVRGTAGIVIHVTLLKQVKVHLHNPVPVGATICAF